MKGFAAFTKKEFIEQLRTYRMLIMFAIFFIFGLMSPLTAKLLPDLLSGVKMQGVVLVFPEPVVTDAYAQFFKNVSQMGLIVILLIFGGVISGEQTKGTLINMLSKGLGRPTVILSKYTAALTLWTLCYAFSCLVNQGYTAYLFDVSSVKNLVFSLFLIWLYGAFILALIFLSSTLTSGNFSGLILTAFILGVLMFLNIFPGIEKLSPNYLSAHNLELISGTLEPVKAYGPIAVTVILIIGCLAASISLFNRKKL